MAPRTATCVVGERFAGAPGIARGATETAAGAMEEACAAAEAVGVARTGSGFTAGIGGGLEGDAGAGVGLARAAGRSACAGSWPTRGMSLR
jgi:hypothetical protein